MQRLEQAVRARLRAVLAPGLEPCVRAVLEQRLEEAALDLLELFQRSLNPGFGLKQEQNQAKEERETGDGATHSGFMVCVKTEEEELDIKPFSDGLRYCLRCGSTLQRLPIRPPLPAQPRCSVCGQSFSRDALFLEHNYGRHPGQMLTQTPGTATLKQSATESGSSPGSRCSICGQDFVIVSGLLEHMSEHLRAPQNNHLQGLRNYCANVDYSDGDEAELDGDGSDSTGSSGSSSLDTSDSDSDDSSDSGDSVESGDGAESGDSGGFEDDPQDTGDMDCAFCGRVFRNSEMLERHIQKHVP